MESYKIEIAAHRVLIRRSTRPSVHESDSVGLRFVGQTDCDASHYQSPADAEKTISINKAGVSVPDSSPFRIRGLVPFTWYSFRLRPFNQAGDGSISDTVLVRTLQGGNVDSYELPRRKPTVITDAQRRN